MSYAKARIRIRKSRHYRIRRAVSGTPERPRLCVRRSLKHIYAQIVEDESNGSLVQISSLSKAVLNVAEGKNKTEKAQLVGKLIAEIAMEKGIAEVVFDRGGYLYHGRVKALADAARETGLKF